MNSHKLPVISTFLEAISLPYKHYRMLLKVGLPLIISSGSLTVLGRFFSDAGTTVPSITLGLFIGIIFCISLVMAIVGCHRIFLIGPCVVEDEKLFNWTGNEVKYAGWWILISICVGLIAIPFSIVVMPFIGSLKGTLIEKGAIFFLLIGLVNAPIYYFAARWSLVLPSSAIGRHGNSLTWSWRLSEGNGWRLTLLVGIFPFIINTLFTLLPEYESVFYALFCGAVGLVAGVVEIGLLSLSYAFLAQERNV